MKLASSSSTASSGYFNFFNNPYEFFLLNEKEFEEFAGTLKNGEQRNICFCGKIVNYNMETNSGFVEYEGKRINVKFNRVTHMIQLNNNNTSTGMYFIYGFIMKEGENLSAICNYYRYVPDFNNDEYKVLVKKRREIMKDSIDLKEQNDFWFTTNPNNYLYNK